ncbi:MAG: hypothetical protein IJG64_03005 [Oscillospiraceae bacterium]|nr:hypothetical protein [Oscillospiraceae bacterium]
MTATKELNNTAVEYINGRIVDSGTHSQLMDHSGLYRNFVSERKEAVSWKVKNA